MTEKTQTKIRLINHYRNWIETTKNPYHKEYAEIMLNSIYEDNYVETFSELGKRDHKHRKI